MTTSTTMRTTEEITPEMEELKGRIVRLMNSQDDLKATQSAEAALISNARAAGKTFAELSDLRASMQMHQAEQEENARTIEMLTRGLSPLRRELQQAEVRQAREKADQLEREFHQYVGELNAAIAEFSAQVRPLFLKVRDRSNAYETANHAAERLAGNNPIPGRPKLYLTGFQDAVRDLLVAF